MRLLAAGLLVLALGAPAHALRVERLPLPRAAAGAPSSIEVVSGQALVKFSSSSASGRAGLASLGAAVRRELPRAGWTVVDLPVGMAVAPGLAFLRGLPGVEAVEPNIAFRAVRTPNDPLVLTQYALSQIDAFAAWEYEVGSSALVTIAVVDAGVDRTHPDLAAKMPGTLVHNFCDPTGSGCSAGGDNPDPVVACDHGTRVAGVAAASAGNGLGIAGVSWGAQLLSIRVFRDTDCAPDCSPLACATDTGGIEDAVNYAISLQNAGPYGKIVLNLSIGQPGAPCPVALATAFAAAAAAGIPVFVASGNDGGAVNSPGNCAGAIPVGATQEGNAVASFSAGGSSLAAHGVVAPGVKVLTTDVGGGQAQATGTSFSAPHAAGLAALVLSAKPTCPGAADCATYVKGVLRASADKIGAPAEAQGAGRINAFKALRLAVNGTLADFKGEAEAIAFPNPFRVGQHGTVSFALPPSLQGAAATIKVYTLAGSLVRELTGLTWDGKNKDGNPVASGTYLFLVESGSSRTRGRVALIR